jgi:hypothetical protein
MLDQLDRRGLGKIQIGSRIQASTKHKVSVANKLRLGPADTSLISAAALELGGLYESDALARPSRNRATDARQSVEGTRERLPPTYAKWAIRFAVLRAE